MNTERENTWTETIRLQAANESELLDALPASWIDGNGNPVLQSHQHSLDWFGTAISEPAVINEQTLEVIQEPVMAEGFHANLRLRAMDLPAKLAPFIILEDPATAKREFA